LVVLGLFIGLAGPVQAQLVRPSKTLYFRAGGGYANYIGDNNETLTSGGWNVLGELGYQFHMLSASGACIRLPTIRTLSGRKPARGCSG
jgi:hypothetical protein